MKKSYDIEVANLVCAFGPEKVLIDYAPEIVIPAFLDIGLERKYGVARHIFREASLVHLDSEPGNIVVGITGRYIVDTFISREQTFQEGVGLTQSIDSMPTAPSALFLLILNNHRLLYVKETAHAPSLSTFKSTLASFLARKRKSFIDEEYTRLNSAYTESRGRVTKKSLYESIPQVDLRITPISSEENIERFLQRFEKLKSLEIKVCKRNGNLDNRGLFSAIEETGKGLESTSTALRYRSPNGLNINMAKEEVASAASSGNQLIRLQGQDHNGDALLGNNESFKLLKPIKLTSKNTIDIAKVLYSAFLSLVQSKVVSVPESEETSPKLIKERTDNLFKTE